MQATQYALGTICTYKGALPPTQGKLCVSPPCILWRGIKESALIPVWSTLCVMIGCHNVRGLLVVSKTNCSLVNLLVSAVFVEVITESGSDIRESLSNQSSMEIVEHTDYHLLSGQ